MDDMNDVDHIVATVGRQASEECAPNHPLITGLDACARDAVVAHYGSSRVKSIVPLLAWREVRACLRASAWVRREH